MLLYILDDCYEFYQFDKDYYNLNYQILGIETYEDCKNNSSHKLWNTIKFGKICLDCRKIRKDKLKRINNI